MSMIKNEDLYKNRFAYTYQLDILEKNIMNLSGKTYAMRN